MVHRRMPDMRLWLFLLLVSLYVTVRSACGNEKLRQWLLHAVLVVVLVESVWGWLQLYDFTPSYHSLYKITGSLFNPGPYAGFVAVGVPLALTYAIDKQHSRWERWLGSATLLATLLVLPATGSRAAWLAALVGIILVGGRHLFIRNWLLKNIRWRRWLVVVGVSLTICLLAGLYFMKKNSADGRWLIWQISTEAIKEHPLFGTGFGSFSAIYGNAQASWFLSGKGTDAQMTVADSPEYAFNEYVQILVELGIVGLALFLAVMVFCIGLPVAERHFSATTASLLTWLVFAAFSYPFSVLPLSILLVVLLAIAASSSQELRVKKRLHTWLRTVFWMIGITVTIYSSYHILPRRTAYHEWAMLQTLYHSDTYKEILKDYEALYDALCFEKKFLFEYGQCLSKTGNYQQSNRLFEEYLRYGSDPMVFNCMGNNYKLMQEFGKAENAYFRASQIIPNRHYPLYLLMKLYDETGQSNKAHEMAERLLNKPVKVPSTAIREMQQEAKNIQKSNQ
ncbi:MAG: O-antigen ligase family protein [Bacteroidales bacterium]|nr:O-antigen ligase family protein [Bacteroidales bacterium]